MKNRVLVCVLLVLMLFTTATNAYALPEPGTAHYPRGGQLTLSSSKQTNNSYAFKPMGKTDNRLRLSIQNAYAETSGSSVTIQMFIINEWGNWIQWGAPETIFLDNTPKSFDFYYTIREKQPFCIVVRSYGTTGRCVIPYEVSTF